MDQTVNINFNISGNATDTTINIAKNIANVSKEAKEAASSLKDVGERLFAFQQITQTVQGFSDVFSSAIQPGIALNTSLMDLSAIAGVTGDKLKEIESYARDTAKTFGTDATAAAEVLTTAMNQYGISMDDPMEASSLLIARSPNALGIGAASFAR